jgi:alkanesulfonate monooxygenase SsuD/methylene tetrahydromethanopterin reductase-like flavin-dependent oxidoreductase (luciferase family)
VDVGVGLPTTTPGTDARDVIRWARRAEEGPFASLGVLDRATYDSLDPLLALAAAAAVTDRVRLVSMIVAAPLRATALLAKQSASINALSGGRLTLGLSIGARIEDYLLMSVDHARRGERLSEQLVDLRAMWEDGALGPAAQRPELLVGGLSGQAYARAARFTDGYVHGGGPPRAFARCADMTFAAWADLGRPGRPRLWGQGYFALGDDDAGAKYLRRYYAFTGPFAERIVAANLTTPHAVRDFVRGYEEAGCDHLILFPTVADPAQLDRLADVLV